MCFGVDLDVIRKCCAESAAQNVEKTFKLRKDISMLTARNVLRKINCYLQSIYKNGIMKDEKLLRLVEDLQPPVYASFVNWFT
jgi:hypothetical protein